MLYKLNIVSSEADRIMKPVSNLKKMQASKIFQYDLQHWYVGKGRARYRVLATNFS